MLVHTQMLQLSVDSLKTLVREHSWPSNLLIGVVSGLVTSALIFVGAVLWTRVLKPKLEDIAYKGVDIGGRWELVPLEDGDIDWHQFEVLELRQNAHRIKGTVTLMARDGSSASPRTMELEGEVCDRFVYARMRSPLKQRVAHVVFLAEVTGDGSRLEGQTTFYNIEDSTITSGAMKYVRADNAPATA